MAVFFSAWIRMCTTKTKPPAALLFFYSIMAFVMSIIWIGFTCDIVVDLLTVIGVILSAPKPLLGLTLLAWGNCLGDMNADVAMTKKGFGEMAITGCMAGPVFNVLVGLGASTLKTLIKNTSERNYIHFSIYDREDGSLDSNAMISIGLLISEMIVLIFVLINGVSNQYQVAVPWASISVVIYFVSVVGLGIYSIFAV